MSKILWFLPHYRAVFLNEADKISIFLVKGRHFLGASDRLTSTLLKYFSIGHFGRELARE